MDSDAAVRLLVSQASDWKSLGRCAGSEPESEWARSPRAAAWAGPSPGPAWHRHGDRRPGRESGAQWQCPRCSVYYVAVSGAKLPTVSDQSNTKTRHGYKVALHPPLSRAAGPAGRGGPAPGSGILRPHLPSLAFCANNSRIVVGGLSAENVMISRLQVQVPSLSPRPPSHPGQTGAWGQAVANLKSCNGPGIVVCWDSSTVIGPGALRLLHDALLHERRRPPARLHGQPGSVPPADSDGWPVPVPGQWHADQVPSPSPGRFGTATRWVLLWTWTEVLSQAPGARPRGPPTRTRTRSRPLGPVRPAQPQAWGPLLPVSSACQWSVSKLGKPALAA